MSFGIALSVRSRVRECTPALFNQVVDSEQTARVCAEIEDALERVKRGEMSREDFETFKAEQKKRLAIFTPHATFPKGRRVNEDAVPSGLSMYDVDHIKSPSSLTPGSLTPSPSIPSEARPPVASPRGEGSGYSCGMNEVQDNQGVRLFQRLVEHTLGKQAITDEGMKAELRRLGICLVHVTPSTEGFRLFFAVPEGMSLEEAQRWMSEQLGDADYDGCVKDLARCSFAVPRDYILYLDEQELFLDRKSTEPTEKTEGTEEKEGDDEALHSAGEEMESATHSSLFTHHSSLTFKGIPYSSIISEWWRRNGGEPQEGERNVKLHKLAVNLRAICDNRREVLMAVMPRFGLTETELKSIVDSACKEEPKGVSKLMQSIVESEERRVKSEEFAAAHPELDADAEDAQVDSSFFTLHSSLIT